MSRKKPFNPFYALLIVVGTAFVFTAIAYFLMSMRALRPELAADPNRPPNALMLWMERHGTELLVGELLVLAVATVGAISTDGYWARRAAAASQSDEPKQP